MVTLNLHLAAEMIFVTQIHFCCLYAVCVWDWIISVGEEHRLIWKSRWSTVKMLYIFTRYWTLLTMPYIIWCYCISHTQETCNRVYRSPVALAMWNQVGAEALLLVRTYVVYERNKTVLVAGCAMLSIVVAYQLWVDIRKMLPLPFLDGVSGPCLPMALPGEAHLLGYFVAPLIFDTIITLMTLVKTIVKRRRGGPSSHLLQMFLKDGFIYFVLISCANLLNGIFYFQRHREMSAIMIPLSIMLSPLLACRMILDLRMRANDQSINIYEARKSRLGFSQGLHTRLSRNRQSTPTAPVRTAQDLPDSGAELFGSTLDGSDYKVDSPVSAHIHHAYQVSLGQTPADYVDVEMHAL